MKELSLIRIIIAGLLLLTVLIVCKRIWRQFSIVKLQKYLSLSSEKENNIYILPTTEVAAYTIGLFRPKVVMSEGMLQTFSDEEIDAIIFHEEYHHQKKGSAKIILFYAISRRNDVHTDIKRVVTAISYVSGASC